MQHKKLSKKQKRWIAVGAIFFVALTSVVVYHFSQPKAVLDYSTAQSFWKQEEESAPSSQTALLVPQGAVYAADPFDVSRQVVALSQGSTTDYQVNVPSEGDYNVLFSFYLDSSGINATDYSLSINGSEVVSKVSVRTLWQNAVNVFEKDRNGNDVMPKQAKLPAFQKEYVRDYLNRRSYPLSFHFKSGLSTLSLTMKEGNLLSDGGWLCPPMEKRSYQDYLGLHPSENAEGSQLVLEAEKPLYKNDNAIVYEASKDVNCTPYATYSLLLNTASLTQNDGAQELTYSFSVPSTGYYQIGVNYNNATANKTVFVRLSLDDKIPFGEMANYPLYANGAYETKAFGSALGNEPFRFYLEGGSHTVSLSLDGTIYGDLSDELGSIGDELSAIYLQLRTLSVQSGDTSREWTPEEDFPGVVEKLTSFRDQLENIYGEVKSRNGSSILNEGNVYLHNAYSSLDGLLRSPQYLPNKSGDLAEGSGSIQNAIASASAYLLSSSLSLDKLVIAPYGDKTMFAVHDGFYAFTERMKSFFGSFQTTAHSQDASSLQVWVNRPTMYIDLMQNMVDSTFSKNTGIKVNFERLPDEGKLILSAAAGNSPDCVCGLSNWLPYELGIRNLSKNLREYPDYNDVIRSFAPGSLLPLVADEIGLGLPETQDFYVTFYRKDILEQTGWKLPSTWSEVIDLLPSLQRKGMNYYIPLSSSVASKSLMTTAPFIEQMGASLWQKTSSGSIVTGLDSEKGLSAIKMMTDFYLLYGMQLQVNNFFDSFRNGSLPIGVSSMETYQKLQYAAPELAGKWDIALAPGITDSLGKVERWEPGSATSCLIMKNTAKENDAWSFLKWWESATTQSDFANTLRNIVGTEYIYIPANLTAFDSLSLPAAHKQIIRQQWEWMAEYPRVPGWYMLERELSNCWNNIVLNGQNARTAIDNSITLINKEVERKMVQFGYLRADGTSIKDYQFSTIEEIEGWQQSV